MSVKTRQFPEWLLEKIFFMPQSVTGYTRIETGDWIGSDIGGVKYKENTFMIFMDLKKNVYYRCYAHRDISQTQVVYSFDEECDEVQCRQVIVNTWVPVEAED